MEEKYWNVVNDVPILNQSIGIMTWFDVYNDNMWYPIFTNDSTQNNIILFSDNRGESFQSIQVPQDFKQQYFTSNGVTKIMGLFQMVRD